MTNLLVGDVYQKIIEDVISASATDFEESGVSQATLQELQQGWQQRLSNRGIAQMPWDPKPVPQAPPVQQSMPSTTNGVPSSAYTSYDNPPPNGAANGPRIKADPGASSQYDGIPNGYPQGVAPTQGGLARAQHLLQQQYGPNANASLNAMQRAGGGLALPGQQQQQTKPPPGLHLPPQGSPTGQPQYSPQQQQAAQRQQMQQQLQQQQAQPRIKVENESPQLAQGAFPQQPPKPNYSQTDGADDNDDLQQWRTMLAARRAADAEAARQPSRMIRDQVAQASSDLQSGLMVPLDEQPNRKQLKRKLKTATSSGAAASSSAAPSIPQLDGVEDEDDVKPEIKDEDDENAINSDLDDPDDGGADDLGDDDDELMETILCTYDKVQRVKNKWKCTLKDGVMFFNGKEWVFHKGMGEFEW